jgi:hypothetical protein
MQQILMTRKGCGSSYPAPPTPSHILATLLLSTVGRADK